MAEIKSINKYLVKRKYKTINGTTYPMDEYQVILYEEDSEDCGFIRPQYQWSATTGYLCDYETYTKYAREVYMVSYDSGATWAVDEPVQERRGEVIAYDSYDCGKPMYRCVDTYQTACVPSEYKVGLFLSGNTGYTADWITDCESGSTIDKSEWISTIAQSSITRVDIGECATAIGAYAFGGIGSTAQTSITSITIPDNVTTFIGNGQFEGLSKLKSVRLPNSFSGTNNNFAFSGCSSLEEITIPINGKIGQGWCVYCTSLRDVTSGSGCTSIDNTAFGGCPELTAVTINATTPPTLGGSSTNQKVFYQSPAALIYVPDSSINLYKNDRTWAMYADRIHGISEYPYNEGFKVRGQYSDSLSSVTCNSSSILTSGETTSIAGNNLKKVTIGNCVTEIGDSAFTYYQFAKASFSSITIPDSVTSIGDYAFRSCSGLTRIDIPSGVSSYSVGMFKECRGMTSHTIPWQITYIPYDCFYYCNSLKEIVIPENVTRIGRNSFYGCSGLTSITVNSTLPPTLEKTSPQGSSYSSVITFDNTNNCPIYVPSGSVNTYKTAENWSKYADKIQAITQ